MGQSPNIVEGNAQNFMDVVVEQSKQRVVLVDFWADWCQPCRMLAPILDSLVAHYDGRLCVVKVNTDEEGELASQLQIRSLPTLRLFHGGKAVDEVVGVQPESTLRDLIDRYVGTMTGSAQEEAVAAYRRGNIDDAVALFNAAMAEAPGDYGIRVAFAEVLIDVGRLEDAEKLLEGVPAETEGVAAQRLRMQFARVAGAEAPDILERRLAENPADLEALYKLGACLAARGEVDAAFEKFLELLRRDRSFQDGVASKVLLGMLDLLGPGDPRSAQYRRRMFALLY